MQIPTQTTASKGGGKVFYMICITRILAVLVDGFIMLIQRSKANKL